METLEVDYNRVGDAKSFQVKLWPEQRGKLHVGDTVLVSGDDVPERRAIVQTVSSDDKWVELVFAEPAVDPRSGRSRRVTATAGGMLGAAAALGVIRKFGRVGRAG